jgi:3-dehydroquinate dehydratase type I
MAETQDGPGGRSGLHGVLGVVGGDLPPARRDSLLEALLLLGLGGVEIRADLFGDPREALRCLEQVKGRTSVLFTVRNFNEGGNFRGDEGDRLELLKAAIRAGATWVDAEWGTGAARELSRVGAPLLISHHDFQGTPEDQELARITREMEALPCRAIKLVPTARRLSEAIRVLAWIEGRTSGSPPRIGFSMGEAGFASRILAISRGSPVTYGSLGAPVAPGQISAESMLRSYRGAGRMSRSTRVVGVVNAAGSISVSPLVLNPAFEARGVDALCLPITVESFDEAIAALDPLRVDALLIDGPFKEEALRRAESADDRSMATGGADFLMVERGKDGRRLLRAINIGIAGFLVTLSRRFKDLRGLEAAVIGCGAGAQTALRALVEAGASPTIYYRKIEEDGLSRLVAGAARRPIEDLKRGLARVIVNASGRPGRGVEPSPVAPDIFDASTCAIEMGGVPGDTPFLAAARAAGARCIAVEDLAVGQAVEEFKIFTGQVAGFEELHENLRKGQVSDRPEG